MQGATYTVVLLPGGHYQLDLSLEGLDLKDPPALVGGLRDRDDLGVEIRDQVRRLLLRVVIVEQAYVGEDAERLGPVAEPAIRFLLQVADGRRVDKAPAKDPEAPFAWVKSTRTG